MACAFADLALEPQRQRLRALQREPRDERRHDHARRVLMKAHLLVELFAVADDGAARRRVVAVEIFRRAVHRDVGAELERPLEVRRQERVVDGMRDAALRAIFEIAAMSVSFSVGFAGVSVKISFVLGRSALRTASGFAVSTNVNSTPKRE